MRCNASGVQTAHLCTTSGIEYRPSVQRQRSIIPEVQNARPGLRDDSVGSHEG